MGLYDSVIEMHHCMGIASLVLWEPELQDNEVLCRNVCLWILDVDSAAQECTSIYLHEPTEAQPFTILKFSVNPSLSALSRLTVKDRKSVV